MILIIIIITPRVGFDLEARTKIEPIETGAPNPDSRQHSCTDFTVISTTYMSGQNKNSKIALFPFQACSLLQVSF